MNNPLISVIIPAYNSAEYLGETLKSVLSQTYTHIEVIVVDDGSTDATEKIVGSLSDSRLIYIKTRNQGNYFARNRGLQDSRGGLIAFMDADDLWAANKLDRQMQVFSEHPDADFCCTGFKSFKTSAPDQFFVDRSAYLGCDDSTDKTFVRNALTSNFIVTSSVLARRKCFEAQGSFDTAHQNAMDYDLWLRIILNHPAYYLSESYVLRRDHDSNIGKNQENTCKALGYIFEKLKSYKDQSKFYRPEYDDILEDRLSLAKYYLGLALLDKRLFDQAYQQFLLCQLKKKTAVIKLLSFVAKHHLSFFVPLIRRYRQLKNQKDVISLR